MVEGRESVKQGSVLDGGNFKTTVALAEGRASEIRCILAMATLEINPVSVCVCVCVCVFSQSRAKQILSFQPQFSIHGCTLLAKVWEASPPPASYLFHALSISWQMSPMFHLPRSFPPPKKGNLFYDQANIHSLLSKANKCLIKFWISEDIGFIASWPGRWHLWGREDNEMAEITEGNL